MNHIAIMDKKMGYISEIVKGNKSIESRWYKNRIVPWNRISKGDEIYFKDSGNPVSAKALVKDVIQISELNEKKFKNIVIKYGKGIQLQDRTYSDYYQSKNYCILILLNNPEYIEPFEIDKSGYGTGCAWMCVEDIDKIKK